MVANPQDKYDNYYRIPELKNGVKTFSQFSAFLRHYGFSTEELAKQGVPVNGYWLDNLVASAPYVACALTQIPPPKLYTNLTGLAGYPG